MFVRHPNPKLIEMNSESIATLSRKPSDFIQPKSLRALLKQSLGLSSRKVSVSKGSSITYLTITVRDASVDLQAVKDFAARLSTWSMSIDDCCTGQSISVEIPREVKASLAAPFIEEIKRVAPTVRMDSGERLSTGAILWLTDQGFHISRPDTQKRGTYIWSHDVLLGAEWAVSKLAFDASQI